MFNPRRISGQRNGTSRSNVLPWCCKAGERSGAYQAGVYEALAEADIHPDWVAGVSIGAERSHNSGNEPAERVAKLRAFWRDITANPLLDSFAAVPELTPKGDLRRALFNQFSATCALVTGAPGFFPLRQPLPGCTRTAPSGARAFTKPSI